MQIVKEHGGGDICPVSREDLTEINRFARKELKPEEVYAFTVILCDNEVDRDGERFPPQTLEELAKLFVGKSGIFDHQWSAKGQAARVYRTKVVAMPGEKTAAGDDYRALKAWAYMLRTEANRDLITEIEGGIKKEVSVGCAVKKTVCSICGGDMHSDGCVHVKGRKYNGKLCWAELTQATDAYEWSFVAVPAQRGAGVTKGLSKGGERMKLKEFLREEPAYLGEVETLEKDAALGRKYLADLRTEVARLGGLAEPELDAGVRKAMADKLDEGELLAVKAAWQRRLAEKYPAQTQLPRHTDQTGESVRDGAFLV